MASIRREIDIAAAPAAVWDAIRDVGAVPERLARGFVVATHLEGDTRVVTYSNGFVAHELIVDLDDATRRIAYSSIGGRAKHHHATMQVFDAPDGRTRLVWVTDVYPNEAAPPIQAMIDQGAVAIRQTLDAR